MSAARLVLIAVHRAVEVSRPGKREAGTGTKAFGFLRATARNAQKE
jgi:hypothetical protein